MALYPAENITNLLYFTQQYWQWCVDTQNKLLDNSSELIVSGFKHIYTTGMYTPVSVKKEAFIWLLGNTYENIRHLDISVNEINVEYHVNPFQISHDFVKGLRGVLFYNIENVEGHAFIDESFLLELKDYYYSVCPFVALEYLALEYEKNYRRKNDFGYRIQVGQSIFREYILFLLGYELNETLHNYPEHENEIKQKLFHEIKMPDFYKLIEYLDRVGLDALETPE